jgi:hypothetical protein
VQGYCDGWTLDLQLCLPAHLPAVVACCRHQADVFHAYQVLVSGGYRPDHIVVMAYDDIANNPENPMPGKVFNRPGAALAVRAGMVT